MQHNALVCLIPALIAISSCGHPNKTRATWKPWEPRSKPGNEAWMSKHAAFVECSKTRGEEIKIVFIGSSSIERWGTEGLNIWNEKYAPLGAVNYGIGGDKTEHVLWRIQNGELDGISPKMVVVYAGTRNIPTNSTVPEIERGITTVISTIHEKLPNTTVLYVALLPRANRKNIEEIWDKLKAVDEAVAEVYVGSNKTFISNMFWDFAKKWGAIKEELYNSDKVHLNADGYSLWDASWNQTFYQIWNSELE